MVLQSVANSNKHFMTSQKGDGARQYDGQSTNLYQAYMGSTRRRELFCQFSTVCIDQDNIQHTF